MKTTLLVFLLALYGCNSNNAKDSRISNVDFTTACDSLQSWTGGIQGGKVNDSTGPYAFAECHTNLYYDLIWVPKGGILQYTKLSKDTLYEYYEKASKMGYKDLECYAFLIPKKKKRESEGDCDCEDDPYDYEYPSTVQVFKRTNTTWEKLLERRVNSFEELRQVKLSSIFQHN